MKFTLDWLKDHLDTSADLKIITDTLTNIGLEVESVENLAEAVIPQTEEEIIMMSTVGPTKIFLRCLQQACFASQIADIANGSIPRRLAFQSATSSGAFLSSFRFFIFLDRKLAFSIRNSVFMM